MELRQLITDHERQTFAKCLSKARAMHGLGFRDTSRSQLSRGHLAMGGLYALFEGEDDPVESMVAGFRLHDLGTLPQSHPKPDMSHLPPEAVLEGGELWSLSAGAGRLAAVAAGAVAGLLQAKAVIIHAIVKPMDLTGFYRQLHFVDACEPVLWPYAETLDGVRLWVQPMILEGTGLEQWARDGFNLLFHTADQRCVVRSAMKAIPRSKTEIISNQSEVAAPVHLVPPANTQKEDATRAPLS
ncbi:MAG TPA: hypothetical protein VMT61_14990 [Candidatus Binataceae bacterium]|nr:hypothetical protein [Candidatus Binataceae bacterium]